MPQLFAALLAHLTPESAFCPLRCAGWRFILRVWELCPGCGN